MRKTALTLILFIAVSTTLSAAEMNLEKTIDRLLNETTRGRIIAGEREVAQDKYQAEKIGYYIPEISFNTTLPSYQQTQNYDNYSGFAEPVFFKRTYFSGDGNLQLKQKIITGGDITVLASFNFSDREYPYPLTRRVIDETSNDTTFTQELFTATDRRRGSNFTFQFSQPIFRNSESRDSYLEARNNLDRANIQWRADRADLKEEGITAFFDLLMADIDWHIAGFQSELADYNAHFDSIKYDDSIITEEAWIESKSERLEKKLALFDAEANLEEKKNDFKHLFDLPSDAEVELSVPPSRDELTEKEVENYLANADKTASAELARISMKSAERSLEQTRNSMGLNGSLNASYSLGRGNVKQSQPLGEFDDRVDTRNWQVSLEFNYPIWDGGASGANLHSQEMAYESARLEYLAAQRNARNKMEILLKRIDINHAKLSLLDQELNLAERKLQDAEERHDIGMISDGTLLENRIFYFEARKNHLATLKNHYLDLTELEKVAAR